MEVGAGRGGRIRCEEDEIPRCFFLLSLLPSSFYCARRSVAGEEEEGVDIW